MLSFIRSLYLLLILQASVPGTSGIIEGKVCEIETCRPISGARLVVRDAEIQGRARTTITDLSGTFRFPQLPPGRYFLQVEADNHALVSVLSPLTLRDGVAIEPLNIEMRTQGTISGRALDENGEPLTAAHVEAMAFRPQGNYRMLVPAGRGETDDRGEFRISGLNPGEYFVRVSPPWSQVIRDTYPAFYYPNTTDPAAAVRLVIAGGAEITGIEPKLTTRGVTVRGRITYGKDDGRGFVALLLERSPSVFVVPWLNPNTIDLTTDEFEIRSVAPGSYDLYILTRRAPPISSEWVRVPLEVGDKDIDNIAVPVIPAGSITGRVTVTSDAVEVESVNFGAIRLSAAAGEVVPSSPDAFAIGQVAKDGTFQLPRVSEMKLFLSQQRFADNWFVSSVRFDGSDALASGFSVAPGTQHTLDITVSNASGTLTGVVRDRQDNPVPAARIVLLPDVSMRSNPTLVRTGVAIERGEFTIETVPPGEYTVIALPDEDEFTPAVLRVQESVEKYERFGKHVHIGARETTRAELTVAPVDRN